MPLPRTIPVSELSRAYANVLDFGALGSGDDDDTAAIQAAIDNIEGKHVFFPQGETRAVTDANGTHDEIRPYRIEGTLEFKHDGQRVLFLAGALLELGADAAGVKITGKDQEFTGLWIKTGTAGQGADGNPITAVPDPCVLISGADGLLLSDLYVACGSAAVLVRIENTVGVAIQGGKIYGVNAGSGSSGLVFGAGVRQFGAFCLTVDNSSYGVIFEGDAETIAFENSDIEQQTENMILVRPGAFVRGLSLVGLHTECGGGALTFVVVESGGGGYGEAVYELRSTASVSQSGDMFNMWDGIQVSTGTNSGRLPVVQNDVGGNLAFTASGISIAANRIGFCGVEPVTRRDTYHVRPLDQSALAMLLRGLAGLGLIGCEEY